MLPLVITIKHVDGGLRRYAFADSPVSIGRSPFAELQLHEPFISRWEGTLRFDAEAMTYFSLGSTNTTYLNGQVVAASEEDIALDVESVLRLGELELRFSREQVAENDLRRKGKRSPTRDNPAAATKTVYLEGADAWLKQNVVEAAPITPPPVTPVPERLSGLQTQYLSARAEWLGELRAQFAQVPAPERSDWIAVLLRAEPKLAEASDVASLLGVARPPSAHSQDIPALRAWLQEIGRGVLPEGVQLDTGAALTRVLGLLEALIQSLAEIHDAQHSVRQRWLGRSPRRSLLESDNGAVVLAYLLNPQADWNDRLRELEQSIREVVTHELALFKATLEGARTLVDALSPEAIKQAEQTDNEGPEAGGQTPNLWSRLKERVSPEARWWQRLVTMHASLKDDDRYERVFLGRWFARSYLAAMGQPNRK